MGDKPIGQTLRNGPKRQGRSAAGAGGDRDIPQRAARPSDTPAGRFKISKIRERQGLPKLKRDQTPEERRATRTAGERAQQDAAISGSPQGQDEQRNRGKLRKARSLLGGK